MTKDEMLAQAIKNEIQKKRAEALRIEGGIRELERVLEHIEANSGVAVVAPDAGASGGGGAPVPPPQEKKRRAGRGKGADAGSNAEAGNSAAEDGAI